MKTIRKSLTVLGLLIFSLGVKAQSAKIYKVNFNNEVVQLKVIDQLEKNAIYKKKDSYQINKFGNKVISRRKGLREN